MKHAELTKEVIQSRIDILNSLLKNPNSENERSQLQTDINKLKALLSEKEKQNTVR